MRTSEDSPEQHSPDVLAGQPAPEDSAGPPERRRIKAVVIIVGLAVVLAAVGVGLMAAPSAEAEATALRTAAVKRGDLTVAVTEGGTLLARESLDIKNEVEGNRLTIVELVDEGTSITQEDVENGMVLVKLDASDLEERASQQEIRFYNSEASYKEAVEDLAIQQKQNESNVTLAELNLKFARMDLERYLGKDLAAQVLEEKIDFSNLADDERLGGTARQELRNLESAVLLASASLANQQEQLDWTQKLYDSGYVGRNELTSDQLERERVAINEQKAKEDLRLFKLYTLPKEAEQLYSDCEEAERELARVQAKARSELAQKQANLKSREASYELDKERLEKVRRNLEKCVIRAPKPGSIVYPGSSDRWRRRRIAEGETVYSNQVILTIPDLSTLAARVNIHETDIEKVQVGQDAIVTVEALPGKSFGGKVVRVSPVASAAAAWLNPDIKVYECDIALDSIPKDLTPGMSATAEIVVARLKNVLYVPIEAVTTCKGRRVCWVRTPAGPALRTIETGHFTEKFVEVTEGLTEGEIVYVDPPQELPAEENETQPARLAELERILAERRAAEQQAAADTALTQAEGPVATPQAAETGASGYVVDGQVNWAKLGLELRGLSDDERDQKLKDIMAKLPEDERKVLEQTFNTLQNTSDEERQPRRPQPTQDARTGK